MSRFACLSFLLALLGFPSFAPSQTYWYVEPGAASPGVGSAAQPFPHLRDAVLAASPGDVVLARPGIHDTGLQAQSGGADSLRVHEAITIRSLEGAAKTTMRAVGEFGPVIEFIGPGASGAVLEGFTITGGTAVGSPPGGGGGGGVRCFDARPSIRRCVIEGNVAFGAFGHEPHGGGLAWFHDGPIVERCVIRGNFAANSSVDVGGGLYGAGVGTPAEFLSCLVVGNHAQEGSVLALRQGAEVRFVNCSLVDNDPAQPFHLVDAGPMVHFVNCILRNGGTTELIVSPTSPPTLDCCNLLGGWTGPGQWNFDADPLFYDPARGDYRLVSGSPCINEGCVPSGGLPAQDLEGNNRVYWGIVDVGADEFAGHFLSRAGAGTVGDPACPSPVVFIEGSTGGLTRRVVHPVQTPLQIEVAAPPPAGATSDFLLFVRPGVPAASDRTALPAGLGDFCFAPAASDVLALAGVGALLPAQAPWSLTLPEGIPLAGYLTFQGVIETAGGGLAITNGVILDLR